RALSVRRSSVCASPAALLPRVLELGIDDVLFPLSSSGRWRRSSARRARTRRSGTGALVERRRESVRLLLDALERASYERIVPLLDGLAPFFDERLERRDFRGWQLLTVLANRLLDRVAEVVEVVPSLDLLASLRVFALVLRRLLDHALDVLLA